jgi:Putative beta barrel porin-7 (BBP7)
MRREVWLGALALVGAVNMDLGAQPLVWKRVERPTESQVQATVRASSGITGASLERPIARGDGQPSQPRTFPDAYNGGSTIGRSAPYQVEQIPVIAAPGSIIAMSGPAPVPLPMGSADQDEAYRSGDQFASDRLVMPPQPGLRQAGGDLPMPSRLMAANEASPIGSWLKTYPVTPPPPVAWGGEPAVETPDVLRPRFYARGEYLLWWTKNDKTTPLVTTGSNTAQNPPRADGALGNPDTVVLFGGDLRRNPFSGASFTVGLALDDCGDKVLEMSGFFLGQQSDNFRASSSQYSLLARPFFATNQTGLPGFPQEFREVVTATGLSVGNISVRAPSQLWGLEPNLLCNWCEGCDYRIDALAGARYLNLRESITIVEDVMQPAVGTVFPNSRVLVTDRFATSNQFYGGQVGLRGNYRYDRFTIEGNAKLALGFTHEQTMIDGFFTLPPGVVNTDPRRGGLLATESNIGNFSRDRFAVVPEVGVRLGYDVTQSIKLTVGYNFLYWSSVMRPGDQIDRNIDVLQVPNFVPLSIQGNFTPVVPARPMPLLKETDYWAQGLTVGLEFRY